MKIGIPISNLRPQAGGGYTFEQDVVQALSRCTTDSGHQFVVITRQPATLPKPTPNVQVCYLTPRQVLGLRARWSAACLAGLRGRRAVEKIPGVWRRSGWFEQFCREQHVELVWSPAPLLGSLDIPYVTTVWDLQHRLQPYFPEVSAGQEWDRREFFYRRLLQRAAYVITGNSTGQREIERFYQVPRERIHLLPHPTPSFALAAASESDHDDDNVLAELGVAPGYLFYSAQFWPHKNHAGLLRALAVLRDVHGLTPMLALSGADKSNLRYIRSLATELGVGDQVRFLGFVSRRQLVALYRRAMATVYVTFFGPENLPPLEAMALGCPVVASRVDGADEQLGDAALLVDPRRPDEIARAVAQLFRDPNLRQTLVERGRQRARRFTPDDFVRGVLRLLDEFQTVRHCWGRTG